MAHNFKVGDRVRRSFAQYGYPVKSLDGKEFTVLAVKDVPVDTIQYVGHCQWVDLGGGNREIAGSLLEPAPALIDPAKTYQTRDGRAVRIYATDGGGDEPVHGAIGESDGSWTSVTWLSDGRYYANTEDLNDLIEVKPEREGWINVYDHNNSQQLYSMSTTREEADAKANPERKRIACLHVKFREGDGL